MVYKHHQTFCPEGQLISKLAEPLTDLRMNRAEQLCRFTFEVQCSPETNEQQTALSTAWRTSKVFFQVIKIMQERKSKWMKELVFQTLNMGEKWDFKDKLKKKKDQCIAAHIAQNIFFSYMSFKSSCCKVMNLYLSQTVHKLAPNVDPVKYYLQSFAICLCSRINPATSVADLIIISHTFFLDAQFHCRLGWTLFLSLHFVHRHNLDTSVWQ